MLALLNVLRWPRHSVGLGAVLVPLLRVADPDHQEVAPLGRWSECTKFDDGSSRGLGVHQVSLFDLHSPKYEASPQGVQKNLVESCRMRCHKVCGTSYGMQVWHRTVTAATTGGDVNDIQDAVAGEPGGPFRPPYFSFQTFWSFIEQLAEKPLPPLIDRSLLSSKSGTDQANIFGALRGFEFIDDEQRVTPLLTKVVEADAEGRTAVLAQLVESHYPAQMELARRNGTEAQLHESFGEVFGIRSADTRRKAVTFFLHAAKTAGLPLSPHFPPTRSGSGSAGGMRPRRATPRARRSTQPAAAAATDSVTTVPGAGSDLHPFLVGLLQELPNRGDTWSGAQRDRWLEMAKLTVDMLYTVDED